MTGNEFLKKLKRLAKATGVPVKIVRRRGKGSHQTIFFGSRFTILVDPKKELKVGTLFGMLQQLGIKLSDL